jgi:hypothetical protein
MKKTLKACCVTCPAPSEKLDVEDHYVAWRQSHDAPQHAAGSDGPFSFCSYPFLLNPRAKSKLLHTEARFLMTQARRMQLQPVLLETCLRPDNACMQRSDMLGSLLLVCLAC